MKTLKILRIVLIGLAVLLIAYFGSMYFLTGRSFEYLYRTTVWMESDIYDFQRFPSREIQNAGTVFTFDQNPMPERFQRITFTEWGSDQPQETDFEALMTQTGTTGFLVIQDDAILYENYFNGFQRDSIFTSFSSAKSFDSTMIGIAIDQGLIGSLDDPVIRYIPELEGRGIDNLTIRHLVTMSSGIAYTEAELYPFIFSPVSDDALTYYYPDLRWIALDRVRAGEEPIGEYFHYNNYHPILEGMILKRVTGMPVTQYLQEKIWKPLGMEYPGSWSLDSEQSSFEKMESGINARAIDYAKFGRLFLNNGNWNGQQIISEEWVREATTPDPNDQRKQVTANTPNGYYKYHWWGQTQPDGTYDFFAAGHLGQFIFVSPDKNAIIVRLGDEKGPQVYWPDLMAQIADDLP